MIGNVNIRVSAGHVNLPLPPIAVFKDSAASVIIEGVQAARDGIAITTVKLAVVNAAGTTLTTSAKLTGKNWTATVPATHFAAAGSTRKGVTVFCGGTDENGTAREWNLGTGDLVVISCDSTAVNLGEYTNVRIVNSKSASPHYGDFVLSSMEIYNGTAWVGFGGSAVSSVNGKTGAVVLDASDVGALEEDGTAAKAEKLRNTATWQEAEVMHDDASVPRVTVYDRSMGDDGTVVGRCAYTSEIPSDAHIKGVKVDNATSADTAGSATSATSAENAEKLVEGEAYAALDPSSYAEPKLTIFSGDNEYPVANTSETRYAQDTVVGSNKVAVLSLGSGTTTYTMPIPDAVPGRVRDWVVYVYAAEDITVTYPEYVEIEGGSGLVKWVSSDPSAVKTIKANTITGLYCTEIGALEEMYDGGIFAVNKVELSDVNAEA